MFGQKLARLGFFTSQRRAAVDAVTYQKIKVDIEGKNLQVKPFFLKVFFKSFKKLFLKHFQGRCNVSNEQGYVNVIRFVGFD